jgi:hypothetical protein
VLATFCSSNKKAGSLGPQNCYRNHNPTVGNTFLQPEGFQKFNKRLIGFCDTTEINKFEFRQEPK